MQKDNDKGFALLEILGGLVVISLLMPLFWSYIEDYLNEMRNQSAAFHADAYNTAARTYIADNNARLHSGTLPATFTADELIRKGYLKGLNRSPFGQSYTTGIRRNTSTGRLEALTCSTGGENIKDDALRSIASLLPGLGGFIGKNGTATGVFGGWTDKPGDYGLSCNGGHIAIVMMGDDLQESDRLYRFQVPGRPELNQMNTAINMGGNNLNNAGNVNGQSATLKGDVTSENGWLITKNDKGWKNITYGGGFTMTDSQWIRAVGGKGIITSGEIKGGKVSGGTVRSDGRLSTGEYLQLDKTAVANTKCSPDGLVGRDSKGAILSGLRANPVRGKKLAQVIAKLLPLQLLRGVGLEQRQHVHLARKSLVEAVNADQIPDLYGSRVPCLQATMHGLPVATRPKIKMVPLQFTPFASDDTYHWQTTM
nr:shufflon system plasmid conjugative transfer pilus tip adhesin PilV [Escherichia coli]